jgi:uncharacterized repeat protein (TIGR02543 family)
MLLTAAFAAPLAMGMAEKVYAEADGDYKYSVSEDGKATITGYTGREGDVVIPGTLGGYAVTAIGDRAFYSCSSMTSATIPDCVTSIGNEAFYYCYKLTTVNLPDGVTSIGNEAFYYCYKLIVINLPDSVTSIGERAFAGHAMRLKVNAGSYAYNYAINNSIPYDLIGVSYTVTFDANGGSVSPNTKQIDAGSPGNPIGTLPKPVYRGHNFKGWYTAKSGGTEVGAYTDVTADVTYYAQWQSDGLIVDIEITKWNIKKNPKITVDLGRYKTAELEYADFDVKIGTATLKRAAKQNMVIDQDATVKKKTAADGETLKLIFYKGKRTADIYIHYLVKTKKKYGKNYSYKHIFKYDNSASFTVSSSGVTMKGDKVFNFNALLAAPSKSLFFTVADRMIFYNKSDMLMAKDSTIVAPKISKSYTLTVVNKKQRLAGKLDKKTLPYKKANSMVGKYSPSCNATANQLWAKISKPDTSLSDDSIYLPISKAKPGDALIHYKRDTRYAGGGGHVSIYLGGGQGLHGSLTYHTTRIGNAEILNPYVAQRSYYLWFYNKAAQ